MTFEEVHKMGETELDRDTLCSMSDAELLAWAAVADPAQRAYMLHRRRYRTQRGLSLTKQGGAAERNQDGSHKNPQE